MHFVAYILFLITAALLIYNLYCLWENAHSGGDMGSAIVFHQGNILTAITAGLALLAHPDVTWYWCFAPLLAVVLCGMPTLMILNHILSAIRKD